MARFYIVETLQTSRGEFMGTTDQTFATVEEGRKAAQAMSNANWTITRTVMVEGTPGDWNYTVCEDQPGSHCNYFYPV
jgi:hypothetical protein